MKLIAILGLLGSIGYASAAVGAWGQCGGKNYNGDKSCISGYKCNYLNEWYSQCVPGSSSGGDSGNKTTTTKKTSTKTSSTKTKTTKTKTSKTSTKKTTTTTTTKTNSSTPTYQPSGSWPTAQKSVKLSSTYVIKAGQTFDGLKENGVWTSYGRGVTGQGDCKNTEGGSSDAVFRLETGATLKNVIIGKDAIEHVHCVGDSCTVENVWWDDVCEDALSLKDSKNPSAKFYLIGGGARDGSDKIVQHNSAGTVYIKNFKVSNAGKLYRSCGNCKNGYQGRRDVVIEDVVATNVGTLAGINSNYGDTATIKNVSMNKGNVCVKYTGNNTGKEPKKVGTDCAGASSCVCKA